MIAGLSLSSLLSLAPCAAADSLYTEADTEALLFQLGESLLALQQQEAPLKGAVRCPATNPLPHGHHVRAGEAVFPLALLSKRAADPRRKKRFRQGAISLGTYLVHQQQSDGSWLETPHRWWGITAHQVFALAAAYPILKESVPPESLRTWRDAIRRGCDFVVLRFHKGRVPVSYLATAAAALLLAERLMPSKAWRQHAENLTRDVLSSRTPEGFWREDDQGTIDVGMSMGQTLPLLALASLLSGSRETFREVAEAAQRLAMFLYPDGSLDAAWGDRCERFTMYGSFGTYGPACGFAVLARRSPAFARAAGLNFAFTEGCLAPPCERNSPVLLGYGPHAASRSPSECPCIYPTVCHSVALAIALTWGTLRAEGARLPTAALRTLFAETKIALVRTGFLQATLSWRSAVFPGVYPPRGGALTHLYVEGLGTLQTASPSLFVRRQILHLPLQRDVWPLTARIESREGEVWYSNLFDTDTELELNPEDPLQFVFSGTLRDVAGRSNGVTYRLKYRFGSNHAVKTLRLYRGGRTHSVVVVEPLIVSDVWPVSTSANQVRFNTESGLLTISIDTPRRGVVLEYAPSGSHTTFPLLPCVRARSVLIRFTDLSVRKARWILTWKPSASHQERTQR